MSANEVIFTVRLSNYYLFVKRPVEVALALSMLLATWPLWLVVAVAIKVDSPGPIIHVQRRLGRHGVPFRFYKFRTMVVGAERHLDQLRRHSDVDGPVFKMRNDPRVTRVGRFLRRSSIDELPQLINVLRGDMSLVGPRPPLSSEAKLYRKSDWIRLAVKPGLTSLWAVNGRSRCSFEEWMRYDRDYIEKMSLSLDTMILIQTVWVVLRGSGAY
ncbi:MAG: sugar transferase [Actinomycetota bacterium]|nr:sugar transferase [Actinomycetota bacterium]